MANAIRSTISNHQQAVMTTARNEEAESKRESIFQRLGQWISDRFDEQVREADHGVDTWSEIEFNAHKRLDSWRENNLRRMYF